MEIRWRGSGAFLRGIAEAEFVGGLALARAASGGSGDDLVDGAAAGGRAPSAQVRDG